MGAEPDNCNKIKYELLLVTMLLRGNYLTQNSPYFRLPLSVMFDVPPPLEAFMLFLIFDCKRTCIVRSFSVELL